MRNQHRLKLTGKIASGALIVAAALGISALASALGALLHGPLGASRVRVAAAVAMSLAMAAVLVLENTAWARRVSWAWAGAMGVLLAVSALFFDVPSTCANQRYALAATVLGAVLGLAVAASRLSFAWRCAVGVLLVSVTLAISPELMCMAPRATPVGAV